MIDSHEHKRPKTGLSQIRRGRKKYETKKALKRKNTESCDDGVAYGVIDIWIQLFKV